MNAIGGKVTDMKEVLSMTKEDRNDASEAKSAKRERKQIWKTERKVLGS